MEIEIKNVKKQFNLFLKSTNKVKILIQIQQQLSMNFCVSLHLNIIEHKTWVYLENSRFEL